MRKLLIASVAAVWAAVSLSAGVLQAQGPYLQSNRLGYTGSFGKYSSLANAQSQTGGVAGAVPQRDLHLFMVNSNTVFANDGYLPGTWAPSAFQFFTFWQDLNYNSTPSNLVDGFVQISDDDAGSVTSASGVWTNGTLTQFLYSASGANALGGCYDDDYVLDCPRFNTETTSDGTFLSYEFSLLASGLAPATFNGVTGVFESASDPTSVSGYFRGIFRNTTGGGDAGFYRVDLALNMISQTAGNEQYDIGQSKFGSATVVPEPSTYVLMLVGMAGMGVVARRRRRTV